MSVPRILDANLNRLGEGLRVLEEVARFLLDDAPLTQELKGLRHSLVEASRVPGDLEARRSAEDVGASEPEPGIRPDTLALVRANARRCQESLRVLEEVSRLPEAPEADAVLFKGGRFALYDLEQRLVSRLSRRERAARVQGLYLILDYQALQGRSEVEVARAALRGGARIVQLRDKVRGKGQLLPVARELQRVCAEAGALFIINDHPDLAAACGADGVHVGQKDLPVPLARKMLPLDRLVGTSAATVAEAMRAQEEGADYIAVGSIYPTSSKTDARPAGLETLREVRKRVSSPLVAIGGINRENLAPVLEAGAQAVAVISAVLGARDAESAARELSSAIVRKGAS